MRSVTDIRSLRDVRTGITAHARSRPRQNGSTHLELYLLDKEKGRLETERTLLIKRQRRVEERLGELRQAMEGLLSQASRETPSDQERPTPQDDRFGRWRKITAEY